MGRILTLSPDREPSLARSGRQRETGLKSPARSLQARPRGEPGTARGPSPLGALNPCWQCPAGREVHRLALA
jgi:hypothetical protein